MSNIKDLLGDEPVLAECSGVNYTVYVTESRILVGKRFGLGENFVNVPNTNVSTLELITKSVLPPLTFAILGAIGGFLVWWFPGQQRASLPPYPYDLVVLAAVGWFVAAMIALWWRKRVAVLRIGILGSKEPITIRMVSTSQAERVFKALKG